MINKINALLKEVENLKAANAEELEALRIKYLSKKGEISLLMNDFRMSQAGWSSAKFKEENTCQSSSISGPSAMLNPKRPKMSQISFFTSESGWRVPNSIG